MTIALFGFGIRDNGEAYHYLAVGGERLEAPVTSKLGPVKSVISYNNGFIVFSCELRPEEYGDFYEYAEVTGQLSKWASLLESVTEANVLNE